MHTRGHRDSHDAWAAAGATGSDYTTILPFLERIQTASCSPAPTFATTQRAVSSSAGM
jgi:hypothetical protein